MVREAPRAAHGPGRLSPADAGAASRVDRRGRYAAVGGARGNAGAAAGGGHHRRRAGALRPVRRPLPRVGAAGGARSGVAPRRHQHARLHRRHLAGGGGGVLSAVRGGDDAHRAGARLAADLAGAVRGAARAGRGAGGGEPAGGDRQAPPPARALRPPAHADAAHRRRHAAREGDAGDRAAGHRRRPAVRAEVARRTAGAGVAKQR